MNLKHLALRFLTVMAVVAVLLTHVSCEDTETTDSTPFILYYSDMTDIGPSMSGIINSPTYKGAEPYDFAITKITVNDELYSGDSFVIDAKTGSISIGNTNDAPVGLYKISISCMSNNKLHEYKDLVEVNMMKPVPDGITVEPNSLQVEYADVIDAASEAVLPTAQVTTDGNHVSIVKYEIAKSESSKFFAVSGTGEISIVKGSQDILPGIYVVSLKLTTGASGEDEGIFENALTVNVTSKPLALTYLPNSGKIEEESALSGKTTFKSNAPELKGSLEGISYAISNIEPATDKIKIDPKTGVLSVDSDHGLISGAKYMVDVKVSNDFAKEGVDFDAVFELEVVEYIEPITNFTYPNTEEIQAVEIEIPLDAAFKGDEVKFEVIDLPAELQGQLTTDVNGTVKAVKGNTIPLGTHTIKVQAANPKSDPANPTVTTFTLTIKENPYYFTYIRYGNNLGLTPEADYANQYRQEVNTTLSGLLPKTDAQVPLTYEFTKIHQGNNFTIDENTGEITNIANDKTQCGVVMVTATAGKGTKGEVSVKTYVFFHYSTKVKDPDSSDQIEVLYSPFVMQVNPRSGGRSVAPELKGVSDISKFVMDYRRTFNFYSFNGMHISGQPTVAGSFMRIVYENYAKEIGSNPNYSAKAPLSYYESTKAGRSLGEALAYVDAADYTLVVNPNKWIADSEYANGCMIGQITITSKLSNVNNGGQTFPIILWFDTNF